MAMLRELGRTRLGQLVLVLVLIALTALAVSFSPATAAAPGGATAGGDRVADLFASAAPAATGGAPVLTTPAPPTTGAASGLGSGIGRIGDFAWKLGLVLLVIWGAAQIARRVLPGHIRLRGNGAISVKERVPLSPRSQLVLVEVDGARLLLGCGDQGVSLVADLSKVDAGATFPAGLPPRTAGDATGEAGA